MDDPLKPESKKEPEIASVNWLFEDTPKKEAPVKPPSPVIMPATEESFELADVGDEQEAPGAVDVAPIPRHAPTVDAPRPGSETRKPSREKSSGRSRTAPLRETAAPVDQVWSRGSEWGGTLGVLAIWTLIILGLLYMTLAEEEFLVSLVILVIGGIVGLLLCYPIIITLERPVRMTPEQAVKDYFAALSHHFPHYRRMWLLLSSAGKVSSHYASFEGFKAYWKKRSRQLRKGVAGPMAPLAFVLEDFRADKDTKKTHAEGRFQVRVFVRGKRDKGAIWSFPMEMSFSRGPDNMWYLDEGTLAERRVARDASMGES